MADGSPIVPTAALTRKVAHKRTRVVNIARLSKQFLAREAAAYPEDTHGPERPRTLEECRALGLGTRRPCPYVGCTKHLFLDVSDSNGSITLNFPDREVWELRHTCAEAVIARNPDGMTLKRLAKVLNLTPQGAGRIERLQIEDLRAELEARASRCGSR